MPTKEPKATILVIEDEIEVLRSFTMYLEDVGYHPIEARDGREGIELFSRHLPKLVFTDLRMPVMNGLDVIRQIKLLAPEVPIVVISGAGKIGEAVEAIKLGAWDYITKPVRDLSELDIVAKRAIEASEIRNELSALRKSILTGKPSCPELFSEIITQDPCMHRIFQYLEAVAPTGQPVLITGQTGTGKEAIARSLHLLSKKSGRFVAMSVGGLDDHLFSDTLFGHLKGSFTGADRARDGMISRAEGGTLFLDEIGDLSDSSQVKLLRLLQEHEYFRLGSDKPSTTDARIVAATNRDLEQMMKERRFREDLFYRLSTHQVNLPPLSSRLGDIPLLLDKFIAEASEMTGKQPLRYHCTLPDYLATYSFPGNIRELKAMVFDAVARTTGPVLQNDQFLAGMGTKRVPGSDAITPETLISTIMGREERFPTLREAQELLISRALELADGNQGVAARYLGITRQGLNKILNKRKDS